MGTHARSSYTFRVLRGLYAIMAVAVILAMHPYTPRPTEDIKLVIFQLGASVILAVFITHAVITRRQFQRPPLLFPAIIVMFFLYTVSAIASQFVAHSLVELGKWASLIVIYLVATQLYRSISSIRLFMVLTCCAVAVATIYAFVQLAGLDPFPWSEDMKELDVYRGLPATFGNPNLAGHTLILSFIMALYLATMRGTRWCGILAALFAVHMVYTQQRSIIVALSAAALLVFLAIPARRVTRKPVLAVATSIIALLVVVAAAGWALTLWTSATGTRLAPVDTSLRLRYNAYFSAIDMIQDRPLLGYGPGNYLIENTPFWTEFEQKWFARERLMNFNVHNDFLEAAVDGGILAGVLYTLIFVIAATAGLYLYASRETPGERKLGLAFAAIFVAFAIDGFFGFNVHVPVSALLIFILAGMLDGFFAATLGAPDFVRSPQRTWFWHSLFGTFALANAALAVAVFLAAFYLQRGIAAHQWQAYDAAEESLHRAHQLTPWDWLPLYHLGIVHNAQGNSDDAVGYFRRATRANPHFIPALGYLAQSQFNRAAPTLIRSNPAPEMIDEANRLLDDAAAAANIALKLCATWPESHDILGRIDFVRATWLKASPEQPRNRYGTPETLWESAAAHFKKAIENGLAHPQEPLRLLAQIYITVRQLGPAEQYLVDAVNADIHNSTVWSTFWDYSGSSGDYTQMRDALIQRIDHLSPPKSDKDASAIADAYHWLARLQQQAFHDSAAAAESHCRAVHAAPIREDLWNAYAQFVFETGLEARFLDCLQDMVHAQANDQGALPQVAAVATSLSATPTDLVRAAGILTEMVRRDSSHESMSNHGVPWAALLVLEQVRRTTQQDIQAARAQSLLGEVFQALGRLDLAHDLLSNAMPFLQPDEHAAVATRLADVLQSMGKTHESVQVLRDAVAADSRNGQLQLSYARALARAGRVSEARLEYDIMLKTYQLDDATLSQVQQELDALSTPVP